MKTVVNIPRNRYIDRLIPYIDSSLIKVLTGQRRVGKSYILKSMEDILRQRRPDANFVTINLEDFAFSHITDADTLYGEIVQRIKPDRNNYIFVDEVQEVADFDRVLRSLVLNPLNDIYVTGSNSAMLSAEMASRLAGRSLELRVHPLTYGEFLIFHNLDDSDSAVDLYLMYGGMPYLRNLPDRSTWNEYLGSVTDALIYRDVVARHSIRNNDFLGRMMLYLADNTGNIITAKRIADYIKSQRITGTVSSVQNYIDFVCDAFLINKVSRWNIEGKRFFEIGEKYYFEDVGIRNAIIGYRPGDVGALLENVVYNHLVAQGHNVHVGVLDRDREIDFVAEKDGERMYIQVAVRVDDPATAEREFGNLAGIPDSYTKMVVTLRDSAPNTREGIRMVSLREFLVS